MLFAELLVLSLATVGALRIALKPPFRRDLRELPRQWVIVGVALAIGALAFGLWIVLRWEVVRHLAAAIALAAMAALWYRARPSYGMSRGLPPGSLGLGVSVDAIDSRTYYLDQAREHGPIYKMSQFGRPVVCVYGLKRGRDVLAAAGDAIVGAPLPYDSAVGKGALRYMPTNTHQQERPIFRQALGTLDLAAGEESIRDACRRQFEAMARDAAATPQGVALRPYLGRFLLEALSRVFFGVDPREPLVDDIGRLIPEIELGRIGGRAWRARLEGALEQATEIMRRIADEAARGERTMPPGTALGTLLSLDPGAIDDPTRSRNLFMAFRLAHGDVMGLLDWIFAELTEHSEWQGKIREAGRTPGEPAGSQPRDLSSRVVLETLRLEQSEFLYRRVLRPFTIEGYTIPAGWIMRILVQESHRDPSVFPDPDRFDPDRFLLRTYDKSEYAPFGADVHGCMGARLALFLGRVLAEETSHGFAWRLTRDGPLVRGTRHRHHWRPSPRRLFQVQRLDGRTAATPAVAEATV